MAEQLKWNMSSPFVWYMCVYRFFFCFLVFIFILYDIKYTSACTLVHFNYILNTSIFKSWTAMEGCVYVHAYVYV